VLSIDLLQIVTVPGTVKIDFAAPAQLQILEDSSPPTWGAKQLERDQSYMERRIDGVSDTCLPPEAR
jgi:hypothetical protein